ncbi:MAG TPA: 16S rRNA (adenine(1518)-N(6)/adenine(1519)-N(6))-dimethyltransferase RsmA [Phycisphaerales bacterium]|nr:16S rRNA (adenine(1518)-N(6)/adenine(1519)-N(6))-dimethyltransferase RsmA [Phycisphaerales bacterium]
MPLWLLQENLLTGYRRGVQTLSQIKALLDERGLRPKRSLGQNFLIDHNLIRKLVDAAGVGPGTLVLEVGPGTGTLTEELLARGCEVIACELDDGLAALNQERVPTLPGGQRFRLVHGDCLSGKHTLNPDVAAAIGGRAFSLVSNLPYGAGTPLLSTLLIDHPECRTFAVTIQREVADRITAAPGGKDFGPLAVVAQALCEIRRVAIAPPECFWPRPDVTSAMLLLERLPQPRTTDAAALSEFCSRIFAQRRKQLGSLLGKSVDWSRVSAAAGCEEIAPTLRAEQLSVEQIIALRKAIAGG